MKFLLRRWYLLAILIIGLSMVGMGTTFLLSSQPKVETGRVASVIDGDTLILDSGEVVRLIGIDSPEKDQKFYYEAKDELSSLVGYGTIRLERDKENRDQYGRLLGYIWNHSYFVNAEMVRRGYATSYPYPPNIKYVEDFDRYEKQARQRAVGMWAEGNSLPRSVSGIKRPSWAK